MSVTQDEGGGGREPEDEPGAVTRVCRKCSAQTTGGGIFCPQCGARFDRRRRLGRRGKLAFAVVVLLLAAGGATAGMLVKQHNDDVTRQHRIAAEQAAHARETARQEAAARQAREQAVHDAEVTLRKALVRDLQRSVTKDARRDVDDGLLDGPILRTDCTPVAGGNVDDVAEHTGDFSCTAVSRVNGDGTESGYRFSATVNYDDGSYSWHLGSG